MARRLPTLKAIREAQRMTAELQRDYRAERARKIERRRLKRLARVRPIVNDRTVLQRSGHPPTVP